MWFTHLQRLDFHLNIDFRINKRCRQRYMPLFIYECCGLTGAYRKAGCRRRKAASPLAQRQHRLLLVMREKKGILTTRPCSLFYQYKKHSCISLCPDHGQSGFLCRWHKTAPRLHSVWFVIRLVLHQISSAHCEKPDRHSTRRQFLP